MPVAWTNPDAPAVATSDGQASYTWQYARKPALDRAVVKAITITLPEAFNHRSLGRSSCAGTRYYVAIATNPQMMRTTPNTFRASNLSLSSAGDSISTKRGVVSLTALTTAALPSASA